MLRQFARKKTPAGRIAKKLKRTEGATRQKAFSMGLSLDTGGSGKRRRSYIPTMKREKTAVQRKLAKAA